MKNLKLKICGLRQPENIRQVPECDPDYIGFIFYKKSSRYVGELKLPRDLKCIARKTGVFVNESFNSILTYAERYGLDTLQLHGSESPQFCKKLKELNFEIIKVFSIGNGFDFEKLKPYEGIADKFLFDTKGKLPGGNGVVFNWKILENYKGETPFFLSGGIGIDSVDIIQKFEHPVLFGLDINSKFEIKPGQKDIKLIKEFIKRVSNLLTPEGKTNQF